jgi:hypothetical protein
VGAGDAEVAVRERALSRVDEPRRRQAARLVAARRQLRAAGQAFEDERFGPATAALARAVAAAPGLLRSPIWGPQLVLSGAKGAAAAVLPGPVSRWGRGAVKRARTRLGRNPVEPGVRPIGRPDLGG